MIINNLLYKTNMLTNQKRWFVFSTAHVIMTNTCWPDVVSLREHWHAVKVFWTSDRQLHNSTLCKHTCLSGSCRGTLWFYLFPAGVSQSRPVDKVIILLFGLSLPTIMQCLWDWFTVRLVTQWIDHILDGKKGVFVGLGTAAFVRKFGLYVCLPITLIRQGRHWMVLSSSLLLIMSGPDVTPTKAIKGQPKDLDIKVLAIWNLKNPGQRQKVGTFSMQHLLCPQCGTVTETQYKVNKNRQQVRPWTTFCFARPSFIPLPTEMFSKGIDH